MTLRCLVELGLGDSPVSVRLDDVNHLVMGKGEDLAPNYPNAQVRIQAITDTLVFRYTHGRFRVVTWLDSARNIMWICDVDLRREDDDYAQVIGNHVRGVLLPDADDIRRLEDEAILDVALAIRDYASSWVDAARAKPGEECPFTLPGGAQGIFLVLPGDGADEIWLALPTLLAQEVGMASTVRELIVAAVSEAVGGVDVPFEQRGDWPGRPLRHYEIVYFWLT